MKKKITVLATFLLVAVTVLTTFAACVDTDLSGYGYPDGFEDALAEYDFSRGEDVDVRVMSFNILAHMESWGGTPVPPRAKMLIKIIEDTAPDVIGVQEMSSDWHKVLGANMPDGYVVLHPDIDIFNKNKTAIIYNADRLELVADGYLAYKEGDENGARAVTWALFSIKATGKYVIVTDTHLNLVRSGQEEKSLSIMNSQADELIGLVGELRTQYACPVIACGDYNCMESGDVPDYSGKAQGEYAAVSVYEKLAGYFADVKYGDGTDLICRDIVAASAPTWDHIFVKGDAVAGDFFVLDGEEFESLSDHYAIFADFRL